MSKKTDKKSINTDEKIKEFGDMLDNLNTDQKKKALWKQIYSNAVEDRNNATCLYTNLFIVMTNDSQGHNTSGPILAKYLEKASKANDQLLHLAELIAADEKKKEDVTPEDMFDAIGDSE